MADQVNARTFILSCILQRLLLKRKLAGNKLLIRPFCAFQLCFMSATTPRLLHMFCSLLTVWHIHMGDIFYPVTLLFSKVFKEVGNEALFSCSKAC